MERAPKHDDKQKRVAHERSFGARGFRLKGLGLGVLGLGFRGLSLGV